MSEDTQDTTEVEIQNSEAVLKALREAQREAKKFRTERDAFQQRVTELEGDSGVALWKQRAVHAHVKSALDKAGVKDTSRLMKVMSMENVDLDDDDNLVGFDDNLKNAKTEWPELFDAKRRVAGEGDFFAEGDPKTKMDGTQAQVARIFGGSK